MSKPHIEESLFTILSPDNDTIRKLAGSSEEPRLTLLLPVEKNPEESSKNATRLKELLKQAHALLKEHGLHDEALEQRLAPVHDILAQPQALLREGQSIAIFIDANQACLMDLPKRTEPLVHVGDRFYLKPVIAALETGAGFHLLALARDKTRLFHGTPAGLEKIESDDIPSSLEEVVWPDDPERSNQHHVGATVSARGREGSSPQSIIHGQGTPKDLVSEQVERFNAAVARSVDDYLKSRSGLLVIVGDERNSGLFRKHSHLADKRVAIHHKDSGHMSLDELHAVGLEATEGSANRAVDEQLNQYQETTPDLRSEVLEDVALAAHQGRVEFCAVASDEKVYAICEPEKMRVEPVAAELADNGRMHDLLDVIAQETLLHGGKAVVLTANQLPGNAKAIAQFRY